MSYNFKVGDKVKYIEDRAVAELNPLIFITNGSRVYKNLLKLNSVYKVVYVPKLDSTRIGVINEQGNTSVCYKLRFITYDDGEYNELFI